MASHYRKDKVAAFLSVVLLAAMLVANGYSAVTKVVLVSPINKVGLLARGYSVSNTRIGSCGVSGDFGPWTLSCGVGHITYVACWPLAMPGRAWTARAVCTDYPWQHAVISISTTGQKLVPADSKAQFLYLRHGDLS